MDPRITSSIIQGGASLIGLPLQGYLQKKSEERQQEYNKENMAIQQGYARDNAEDAHLRTLQTMNKAQKFNVENAKLQQQLNEESAVNAHNRNLDLYEKTQSTRAKVAELEGAGLSIGLMNGTPSVGGASSGGTASTSVSGMSAPGGAMAPTAPMGVTQAQTLNIMDTLNSLGGNIMNVAKAMKETEIADAQAEILRIEASMKEQMTAEELTKAINENLILCEDLRGKTLDNDLKARAIDNQVKLVEQQVQLNVKELEIKDEQKTLLQQQIQNLLSDATLSWQKFSWEKTNAENQRKFEKELSDSVNKFKQQMQDDQQEWADSDREDKQNFEWFNNGLGLAENAVSQICKAFAGNKKAGKWLGIISKIFARK